MGRTSWFAIFVAILVAGTYYVEFYQVQNKEARQSEESKIVAFPADQIHQVEVENAGGKAILKRDADGWSLIEPVKDWADNQFTEDFINGLAAEKSIETAAEGAQVDWSIYGLDKGFAKVTFTNQQGASIVISVSNKKNIEGNVFLRRGQEEKVLVASSQWSLRAEKPPGEFRDKRFFRGKISTVEKIWVRSEKDEFELTLKDNRWVNEKQPEVKIDQNKVREILTSLNEVRAQEFLNEIPKGLKTRAAIRLQLKDKSWEATIQEDAKKSVYGVIQDPAFYLKLDPGQTHKFVAMNFANLRDRREAFDFQNLLVQHIEIQAGDKKVQLTKDGDTWKNADGNVVRSFIARLSDSAVSEYLEPQEQAAFKNPTHKILLKDAGQKLLYELSWGPQIQKKAVVGEKTLILAKSNLYKDVFGLDQSVIDSWDLMKLMPQDQNQKSPPPQPKEAL